MELIILLGLILVAALIGFALGAGCWLSRAEQIEERLLRIETDLAVAEAESDHDAILRRMMAGRN